MVRFNKRANPVPSKTSHNTLLEVIWTAIPALILVLIAVPSINLLAEQYKSAAEGRADDQGHRLPVVLGLYLSRQRRVRGDLEHAAGRRGRRRRACPSISRPTTAWSCRSACRSASQTIGADVIHSFAVPSLWFKIDAVPGPPQRARAARSTSPASTTASAPSCAARATAICRSRSRPCRRTLFEAWVRIQQGGTLPGEAPPRRAAAAAAAPRRCDLPPRPPPLRARRRRAAGLRDFRRSKVTPWPPPPTTSTPTRTSITTMPTTSRASSPAGSCPPTTRTSARST